MITKIKRESNIELLRIIAMLMIVTYHVFAHGIAPTAMLSNTILQLLCVPVIFGVNIFVLISGYFGIRLSWRSFLSLMWLIAFYKLFHLVADTYVLSISHPVIEWFVKPLSGPVSGGGWFIDIYVLLMLISPLLNKLLMVLTRREYLLGLGSLLLLDIGYGFVLNVHFDASGYSLLHFIVLYFLGYGLSHNFIKTSKKIVWWFIINLFIMMLFAFIFKTNQWYGHLSSSYSSPFVLFGAVSIFIIFTNQSIGYRPIINFLAASMLPVYLIHEGGNVSQWYYQLIASWFKDLSFTAFILHTIILIISLFILAILVDQARKWLWQKFQVKVPFLRTKAL